MRMLRILGIVLALTFAAAPAQAQIAFARQSNNGGAGVADGGTVAYPDTVGAGSLLTACIGLPSATVTVNAVTDTLGNTWQNVVSLTNSGARNELWYAHSPSGGANTVTFDWTGAANGQLNIQEYTGFDDGVTVGPSNSNAFVGTITHAGSITTTVANSLILACYRHGSAFTVNAREANYVALDATGRGDFMYLIASSTLTTDADVEFAEIEQGPAVIASFSETVSGGGSSPGGCLTMLGVSCLESFISLLKLPSFLIAEWK